MKKYGWAEAALLLALPLWAALEFSRGHPLSGIVLIAAAFAIIFIHYFSARRETRRKHEKLQETGRTDGRYLAEHLNDFGDLQADSAVVLPANFLPRFEAELAKASETNPASSRSEARSSTLRPRLSSQTHSQSSRAERQGEEFPVDGDAHCGEPMKPVRHNPKIRMLTDGRYLAEHINDFDDLQSDSAVALSANLLPRCESEPAKASEPNPASSRSEASSSTLTPWLSSQTQSHSSDAELQSEEFPLDGDAHCGDPMKLVRVIPKTRMLSELYVFKCARCGHVKTQEEQPTRWRSLA
jgi:hypothetical protein